MIEILMMTIFYVGTGITLLLYLVTLVRFIACHKKHHCKNDNCPIRSYCNKTAQSAREKAEIRRLKRELRRYVENSSR